MQKIKMLEREMTEQEFSRMKAGFDGHTIDNSVEV